MKIENVIKKFNENTEYLCPKCKSISKIEGKSLVCQQGHSYDFSKKGYIHLINNYKPAKYTSDLFEARDYIFSRNFYKGLLEKLDNELSGIKFENLLDIGCGEGYYIRNLKEKFDDSYFYGLDNSKDAIELAVKKDKLNPYMVANLASIPFADNSVDIILNILSPANYGEFSRVLKDEGLLIKVIPGENYLKEIREIFFGNSYSNKETKDLLTESMSLIKSFSYIESFDLSKEDAKNFLKMTPLSFSKEITNEHIEKLKSITIDMEILILK